MGGGGLSSREASRSFAAAGSADSGTCPLSPWALGVNDV